MTQNPREQTALGRQSGMVSIIVTLIMMLVISMIVLGFAEVSRREQRSTLDRQLSAQAFFAAESGVNDARQAITEQLKVGPVIEKLSCNPDTANYPANPVLDATNKVSYPCLLVSTRIKNLTINPLAAGGKSSSLYLEPVGIVKSLHVNWNAVSSPMPTDTSVAKCNPSNFVGDAYFPKNTAADWDCAYGVVRLDIVPLAGGLSRAVSAASTKTIFLYPVNSGGSGSIDFATANGALAEMNCKSASGCDIDITNINATNVLDAKYALRFSGVYVNGAVSISGRDVSGADLELRNGQIQVDVTGKAQDVLRRVQVRIPLTTSGITPDFAVQSGSSVCKRFESYVSRFSIPIMSDQDLKNPMCRFLTTAAPPSGVVLSTDPCNRLASNKVPFPNFQNDPGPGPGTSSVAGFTSQLPNRGSNTYPDDNGTWPGALPGYLGGYSIHNDDFSIKGGYLRMSRFPGDAPLGVPAADKYWYSNPYQYASDPPGTASGNWEGILWETTVGGLKENQKYDFTAYFANVVAKELADPFVEDPLIEMSVDGTIIRARERVPMVNTAENPWSPIGFVFATGPGQTSVKLQIADYAANTNGDDFAMTSIGLYECQA